MGTLSRPSSWRISGATPASPRRARATRASPRISSSSSRSRASSAPASAVSSAAVGLPSPNVAALRTAGEGSLESATSVCRARSSSRPVSAATVASLTSSEECRASLQIFEKVPAAQMPERGERRDEDAEVDVREQPVEDLSRLLELLARLRRGDPREHVGPEEQQAVGRMAPRVGGRERLGSPAARELVNEVPAFVTLAREVALGHRLGEHQHLGKRKRGAGRHSRL